MPKINPEIEAFARIKVVGIGGSGKNAVNHMISSKVQGVDFIAVNTDAQDLHHSLAKHKVHIGKNLTRGLGTGMNPEIGRRAAEAQRKEIEDALKDGDMIFIAADGRIVTIAERTKPKSLETVGSAGPAIGVLEVLGGTAARLGIRPGDRIVHPLLERAGRSR